MKAVVTGGAGFIGSHLVDLLLSRGFSVHVLDNCSTGRVENLQHHQGNDRLSIRVGDISDQAVNLEQEFRNASYVFHLAALADIVPSIQAPEKYYKANVDGTFRVMEAARRTEGLKKLVYAASSSCYGIPDHYPTPETAEVRPQYPYALTKYLGEQLCLHWGKVYKVPVISTRFFNVYGPRSRTSGTYGAVFGVFLAQKLAGKPYTVVGDGTQTRDFTFVTDVCDALFQLSQSHLSNEVFNIGSGKTYSVNRLIELLGGDKVFIPKRPGEPDCTFADTSKIESAIQWKAKTTFEAGIQEMLRHIDYWKQAPVWTPDSIKVETKLWFEALGQQA